MKSETKHYIWKIILTICGAIALFTLLCFYIFELIKEEDIKKDLNKQLMARISKIKEQNNSKKIVSGRNIFLYQAINKDSTGSILSSLLKLSKDNSDINLYINVPGGYHKYAFALVGVINSLKCKVNMIASGYCSSVGSILLCSSTGKRIASPNVIITVYIPGKNKLKSSKKITVLRAKRLREFWKGSKRVKLPLKFFDIVEDKNYRLSASEALKYGIVDRIETSK